MAQSQTGQMRATAHWANYILFETFTDDYKRFMGRPVGEMAADQYPRSAPTGSAEILE